MKCSYCGEDADVLIEPSNPHYQRYKRLGGNPPTQRLMCAACRSFFRDYFLRKTYGISLKKYNQMLEKQGGACAICSTTTAYTTWRGHKVDLFVDHNHTTGKVRGLLCGRCNTALGFFECGKYAREDSSRLVKYLLEYDTEVQSEQEQSSRIVS